MGKSKKCYKKCTVNKPVIKKPKIIYILNDIIFKNCNELEREVINKITVRYICNKKVKLDKSYCVYNLNSYSKSSLCNFTAIKQLTLNFFWKN
jgi:hypothetical protein